MNILKDAIRSVERKETGTALPERIANVLHQLSNSRSIDEDARSDIISIMDDSIELAGAMVNQTYPVELVLRRVTNVLATAQRILMHTEAFRPGRLAFGAMLPDGQLLDFVASTHDEAQAQLDRLMQFGVPRTALVVPVRVSSQYVMQPQVRTPLQAIGTEHSAPPTPPPFTFSTPSAEELQERQDRAAQIRQEIADIAGAQVQTRPFGGDSD
jgi:hypothetical protein